MPADGGSNCPCSSKVVSAIPAAVERDHVDVEAETADVLDLLCHETAEAGLLGRRPHVRHHEDVHSGTPRKMRKIALCASARDRGIGRSYAAHREDVSANA